MATWMIVLAVVVSVIAMYPLYNRWNNIYESCIMFYHRVAIKYMIWKAQRALNKINKGDIADAIKFEDNR